MIEQLDQTQIGQTLPELVSLLQDAVDSGASVGFLSPLSSVDAHSYWQEVLLACNKQSRILLAARQDSTIVGTVQLDLVTKPNGNHRAEVQKLLVHRRVRRQGWGRKLMVAVEAVAREAQRSLLVLDTRKDTPAEKLYRSLGYTEFGIIPQYARDPDGSLAATVFFYRFV